jgi:hypothetical protein
MPRISSELAWVARSSTRKTAGFALARIMQASMS